MPFQTRLTMGTFARWNPWFARFTSSAIAGYMKDVESTTKFAQDNLGKQLNEEERRQIEAIRTKNPSDPRLDPEVMGRNMFFSMRTSKQGYITIPQNLWDADLWDLSPLDQFPTPLYVTGATGDSYAPIHLQRFLAKAAPKATTKFLEHPGGHMSYSLLFEELFAGFARWDGKGYGHVPVIEPWKR